jgi:DNA-directed RNA polymerase subunit RPC12/RpoP
MVPLANIKTKEYAVPLREREGVFVHAFKCMECGLEFHLFSWRANRHRVGEVHCPECGRTTRMIHKRACVNENKKFDALGDREIFSLFDAVPGLMRMDEGYGGVVLDWESIKKGLEAKGTTSLLTDE